MYNTQQKPDNKERSLLFYTHNIGFGFLIWREKAGHKYGTIYYRTIKNKARAAGRATSSSDETKAVNSEIARNTDPLLMIDYSLVATTMMQLLHTTQPCCR
mmetsp:Transcript_17825/g.33858  ORF Transcript_17825/g.33858 Transcript_17825/m.33858 type:complete len:101 (+) Transcript_17825:103-405(+)